MLLFGNILFYCSRQLNNLELRLTNDMRNIMGLLEHMSSRGPGPGSGHVSGQSRQTIHPAARDPSDIAMISQVGTTAQCVSE